ARARGGGGASAPPPPPRAAPPPPTTHPPARPPPRLYNDRTRNLAGLAKVLTDWTPEEAEQLADSLSRLNLSIERLDGRPWPRD
ncbi:MarR family transcriptional regulator, partial [Streptomyces anulatus]